MFTSAIAQTLFSRSFFGHGVVTGVHLHGWVGNAANPRGLRRRDAAHAAVKCEEERERVSVRMRCVGDLLLSENSRQ